MAARGVRRSASGRPFRRSSRSGKPKTKVGQMLYKYWQPGRHDLDFTGLVNGGDTGIPIVDHSVDFANSIVRFRKLTIRWFWHGADAGNFLRDELLVALSKQDEDDAGTYPTLDLEETVEEMRRDNKMVRGPWIISTPSAAVAQSAIPPMAYLMKPMVLKNFVLGPEEDLLVSFTNLSNASFQAAEQILRFFPMGFYRKMPI